ncbi:gamma carbonic anhydrase family protein [Burkholderia stagnalis]|uniref:gamma carbonic anhydrase family protein n=1 Tax=Burkholderia stagnalis TaxID=1503054 RepID=UPI00075A1D28|nr:gamma carbonic anhydrase family protein [Burkholderia stagnalis]KWI24585.1 gamma carbonic anhydrase family protein [Burkholderia stagnalis]KWI81140.1 gamma carbonic anhydrase family protein [Burkholderia stagnalis]MDY7806666.1 gamma carbonic anhydrase family protein [Burkholderia stagnalis]
MPIYQLGDQVPTVHDSAFVAETAAVIGAVQLDADTSVWFGATLRGDTEPIIVGSGSNIQDGAVLHTEADRPLTVAPSVTVGHQAVLHGCTIGEGTLIGIQAVVLDGAVIGRQCLVAAGTIVPPRKVFPDRALILGVPAKVVRILSDDDVEKLQSNIHFYAMRRRPRYLDQLRRLD